MKGQTETMRENTITHNENNTIPFGIEMVFHSSRLRRCENYCRLLFILDACVYKKMMPIYFQILMKNVHT